jgi:type IV pilus assembly protein PilV
MKHDRGFTLLEVMMAVLIGTIGLMGTVAVQQSILNAAKSANEAGIAYRLASQRLEEISSRPTTTQSIDTAYGLGAIANGAWSTIEFVDAQGRVLVGPPTSATRSTHRWQRQWKVTNTGFSFPYVISVVVTYSNEGGVPKSTRLDLERRKTW